MIRVMKDGADSKWLNQRPLTPQVLHLQHVHVCPEFLLKHSIHMTTFIEYIARHTVFLLAHPM